jgi:hypothetical protein
MNYNSSLSTRFSRPQTLASAFGGLMKIFGGAPGAADIETNWDKIVGAELARLGKLSGVRKTGKKFNITLRAKVPAMKTELSYRAEEFAAKINKYMGYDAVGKIFVK